MPHVQVEVGRQQLGVTASGELSWDMIRDALIEVTFGGTTCPSEEVCCLMAAFLQPCNASHYLVLCTSWT